MACYNTPDETDVLQGELMSMDMLLSEQRELARSITGHKATIRAIMRQRYPACGLCFSPTKAELLVQLHGMKVCSGCYKLESGTPKELFTL
jgi:hypothetical protein